MLQLGWASAAAGMGKCCDYDRIKKLTFARILHFWEVPTWKINLWKFLVGKVPNICEYSALNAVMHRDVRFLLMLVTAENTILS